MALMYTPMVIAASVIGGIALFNLLNGAIGAIIGVLILGIIAIATGFQAVTALRDLGARPTTTRGVVERMWDKGTVLWMSRTYYALVRSTRADDPARTNRHVFVVSQEAFLALTEGASVVIEHWPHTHTVMRLSTVERAAKPARASASERRGTRRTRPTR
ncbi:MAG: hypothetical protein R3C39_04420 [Dehalococcoidia bacterium]